MEDEYILDPLPLAGIKQDLPIIKVIGVGGGGSNAVNQMCREGITNVTFVVCNTDKQDLRDSPVPCKLQLGDQTTEGLGAGAFPEIGRQAAEESIDQIRDMLSDNTKMVFITAGMGGGTGTGASPVIARVAKEMNILTIGIVTIPFLFEGEKKIRTALEGVAELNQYVDAILVINNEKLRELYPKFSFGKAFRCADDVLATSAKSIAEIITVQGYINLDFADVKRILKDGNVAVMNTGTAAGENRITQAIQNALTSPLLDFEVSTAKKILLNFYCAQDEDKQVSMEEIEQVTAFMKQMSKDIDVVWGLYHDNMLDNEVRVTLIATGFDIEDIPGMDKKLAQQSKHNKAENNRSNNPTPVVPQEEEIDTPRTEPQGDIDSAIKKFYNPEKPEPAPKEEAHLHQPATIVNLDDFEDEQKLKLMENVPAWKRRG